MNDLPVIRKIASQCKEKSRLVVLDEDLDPRVLKAIISHSHVLLASRFHAMVSGLATGTPTVVVGWSHKYREVMKDFELERFVLPFSDFRTAPVVDLALKASEEHESLSSLTLERLPGVQMSSRTSLTSLREATDG